MARGGVLDGEREGRTEEADGHRGTQSESDRVGAGGLPDGHEGKGDGTVESAEGQGGGIGLAVPAPLDETVRGAAVAVEAVAVVALVVDDDAVAAELGAVLARSEVEAGDGSAGLAGAQVELEGRLAEEGGVDVAGEAVGEEGAAGRAAEVGVDVLAVGAADVPALAVGEVEGVVAVEALVVGRPEAPLAVLVAGEAQIHLCVQIGQINLT